ncbi:chitin-binding protein [Paenibacillus sambharensis]|uniref:Chitin-binding protein n=1 Tax=Paenibacillus sambharensis TaxID=1803190 RepID=A0A2W1LXT0_9BACL|nr:lytic polysaccharide monooxygenase [Paenibacillus sambharensis]PZD96501.1 chitin-binding protein [Paenibacillus sambharensis]
MTDQVMVPSKMPKLKLLVLTAGAMFMVIACSLLLADRASAHGWVENSRSDLCYDKVNKNCGPVMYEPWSIEGRGDFPEIGVPDGQIAGGGGAFPALDEQTQDRWTKIDMKGGPHTFRWDMVANHSTNTWDYYITRKGWDPNSPLKREDLELFCRYEDHGALPPMKVYNDCFIPNDREGYYVIVAVWDIFDTVNAFYQVIDVNLTIDPSQPTVPAPGFPGDPDRFGDIPQWVSIRPYLEGEVVLHKGKVWKARWWTRGQEPGTHEVWELIGDDPGSPTDPTDPTNPTDPTDPGHPTHPTDPTDPGDHGNHYPAWDASKVYTNEIVSHNGQLWQAQWWTQGQEPGTTGQWGPWQPVNP